MSIMDNIYIYIYRYVDDICYMVDNIYILYTYQLSIVDTVYCMDDAWMIWVRPFAEMQGIIRQGALPWGDGGL